MFIAIEGIDGAGKTTLLKHLELALANAGYDPLVIREPGGTPAGEVVRQVLKSPEYKGQIPAMAELLLFYASRSMVVENIIKPALADGKIVLADRFEVSTFAYQGVGLGLTAECIEVSKQTLKGFGPDLYLFVDADTEVCLARRKNKSGTLDAIESRGSEFFERARRGFKTAAALLNVNLITIDGNGDEQNTLTQALRVISDELRKREGG